MIEYNFDNNKIYRAFVRTTYTDWDKSEKTISSKPYMFPREIENIYTFKTNSNIKVDPKTLTAPNATLVQEVEDSNGYGLNVREYNNGLLIIYGTMSKAPTSIGFSNFENPICTSEENPQWGIQTATALYPNAKYIYYSGENTYHQGLFTTEYEHGICEIVFGHDVAANNESNSLTYIITPEEFQHIDLSGYDNSNITSYGRNVFAGGYHQVPGGMDKYKTISNINDINKILSNITSAGGIMECCDLDEIDLDDVDFSNLTSYESLFSFVQAPDVDLNILISSNITSLSSMFEASSFKSITFDVNSDTSNITDMSMMFNYCDVGGTLDLSGFDTSNVTSFTSTFDRMSGSFTVLDFSSFDFSSCDSGNEEETIYMISYMCTDSSCTYADSTRHEYHLPIIREGLMLSHDSESSLECNYFYDSNGNELHNAEYGGNDIDSTFPRTIYSLPGEND